MSYSSLFSSGLAQLWDTSRSPRSATRYRSFLSFDSTGSTSSVDSLSVHKSDDDLLPKYNEHDQFDQYDPFNGPEYPIHLIPSSASRLSSESDPPPTGCSSSFDDDVTLPLHRHRSLPDAKPVPNTIPPSIPPSTRSSWHPRRHVSMYTTPPAFFSFSSEDDDDNDDDGYFSTSSSSSSSFYSLSEDSVRQKSRLSSTSTVTLYHQLPHPPHPGHFSAALQLELIPSSKSPKPSKVDPTRTPSRATSTVSTRYRREKRSDALARLEGRERPPNPFAFLPPAFSNLNFRRRPPTGPRLFVTTPSESNNSPVTFVSFTSDDEELAAFKPPNITTTTPVRNNLSPSPPSPVSSSKGSRKKLSYGGLFSRSPRERDDNFIDLK